MKAKIENKYGRIRIESIGTTPAVVGWGETLASAKSDFKKAVRSVKTFAEAAGDKTGLDVHNIEYVGLAFSSSPVSQLATALKKWTPTLSHEDSDLLIELGWSSLFVGGFTHEQSESLRNAISEWARAEAIKELKEFDKVTVEIDGKEIGEATLYKDTYLSKKPALWVCFEDVKKQRFSLSKALKSKRYNLTKVN